MRGVGVFGDVEVLLDDPPGVGQEGPLGADGGVQLQQGVVVVGGDRDDLGVGYRDLRVVGGQFPVLPVLWGSSGRGGG